MEPIPNEQQMRSVLEFLEFLGKRIASLSQHVEDEAHFSPQEFGVLRVLSMRGSLMVKEIAQEVPAMNLSKLTRVLDRLEAQGYITRTLNREDRRSFLITITEPGMCIVASFMQNFHEVAQTVLGALTPTERLMLIELFAKVRTNWPDTLRSRSQAS